jgi:hypothetical protein
MWGGSSGKNSGARGYCSAAPHCMLVEIGDQSFRVQVYAPAGSFSSKLRNCDPPLCKACPRTAASFPWRQE